MVNITVATNNTRGFLKELFDYPFQEISFFYNKSDLYEVSNFIRNSLASAIQWRIFDYLGIFQVVKPQNEAGDILFSYNRFLKTEKPYIVLLENPSGLVNYCWERPNYLLAKKMLKILFNNPKLYIICMSKICEKTIGNLYNLPYKLKIEQIYPLVRDDLSYNEACNIQNCMNDIIECLFVSSDFNLKGGCDLISTFEKLKSEKVHLTCITRTNTITKEQLSKIEKLNNIDVIDFNLTRKELNEYYKKACLLLNPTRMDSFSLVTLEAMKYGCAILGTDMYALKEMVIEDKNGYLVSPMYNVWDDRGVVKKYYRDHKQETLKSGKIDHNLAEWLSDKILSLLNNRSELLRLCNGSIELARGKDFSEKSIANKWINIINKIAGTHL